MKGFVNDFSQKGNGRKPRETGAKLQLKKALPKEKAMCFSEMRTFAGTTARFRRLFVTSFPTKGESRSANQT